MGWETARERKTVRLKKKSRVRKERKEIRKQRETGRQDPDWLFSSLPAGIKIKYAEQEIKAGNENRKEPAVWR